MIVLGICLCYNLYFIFLIVNERKEGLLYLDVLLEIFLLLMAGGDMLYCYRKYREQSELLKRDTLIYRDWKGSLTESLLDHEIRIMEEQNKDLFDKNCNLQDYITKWCHEVKFPLTASFLIAEKIVDASPRNDMKEQLEKMNLQLKSALIGCHI